MKPSPAVSSTPSLSIPGVRALIAEAMPLLAAAPEGTRFTPIGGKGLDALGAPR